jgi:hypothetical protein
MLAQSSGSCRVGRGRSLGAHGEPRRPANTGARPVGPASTGIWAQASPHAGYSWALGETNTAECHVPPPPLVEGGPFAVAPRRWLPGGAPLPLRARSQTIRNLRRRRSPRPFRSADRERRPLPASARLRWGRPHAPTPAAGAVQLRRADPARRSENVRGPPDGNGGNSGSVWDGPCCLSSRHRLPGRGDTCAGSAAARPTARVATRRGAAPRLAPLAAPGSIGLEG